MKYTLIVVTLAFLTFSAMGQAKPPAPGTAPAPAAGATPAAAAPAGPQLKFIDEGDAKKKLADPKGFTPKVMSHNDARDVLRKLVKESQTSFIVQFFKGAPDRDLRDDLFRYVIMPKENGAYTYQSKYEYAEVDVDNPLYKDLIDNLSFKKKFGDKYDFPYVLYMYQGKGYMVHGPGTAREIYDLRREVEVNAKKEKPAPAATAAPAAGAPAPATPPKL